MLLLSSFTWQLTDASLGSSLGLFEVIEAKFIPIPDAGRGLKLQLPIVARI